ncbi:hypothetical protein HAX54_005109, partial [Datura stramonium]|nr:hypothetical protein [Datura stramonium]
KTFAEPLFTSKYSHTDNIDDYFNEQLRITIGVQQHINTQSMDEAPVSENESVILPQTQSVDARQIE